MVKFLHQTDLTDYLSAENMHPVRFEHAAKNKILTMRIPEALFAAVKSRADKAHIPYQRFIRAVLETAVSEGKVRG